MKKGARIYLEGKIYYGEVKLKLLCNVCSNATVRLADVGFGNLAAVFTPS